MRRRLDHLERRADVLHLDPGAALRAHVRGGDLRHPRVEGARDRARRRRRLRLEAQRLRRGVRARAGLAACAGRPVKWIETRSEAMVSTIHGRDQLQTATLAADRDGRMQALRVHLLQDCGAYLQLLTPTIAHLTVFMVPGAYDMQHVDITLDEVFTNTTPTDAYRGAGPPRGHAPDRAADGRARRRARPRRRRGAAAQLHHRVPVHLGDRALLRLGRLRQGARQGARDGRLRRLRGAPRRGARRAATTAASGSRPGSRSAASRRRP